MAPPGNGIFVVRGEMATVMTAMKRGARWNSSLYQEEEQDPLMKQFLELKSTLAHIEDLRLVEPNIFLQPFLDVIRSEETTGPITSLALSTINKFLSYGLIDPTHPALATTVENIADAVTHARFVGTDQASDGVVLMKIVLVLRTLMLNPEGSALTNESVCEVMLSCFRICFEPRLNVLLRRTAEHALKDIVLLLFMRLPQFAEERSAVGFIRKLKMISGGQSGESNAGGGNLLDGNNQSHQQKKRKPKSKNQHQNKTTVDIERKKSITEEQSNKSPSASLLQVPTKGPILATTPATPVNGNIVDMQGKILQTPTSSMISTDQSSATCDLPTTVVNNETDQQFGGVVIIESVPSPFSIVEGSENISENVDDDLSLTKRQNSIDNDADGEDDDLDSVKDNEIKTNNDNNDGNDSTLGKEDFINSMGVRFTPVVENETSLNVHIPYGLPCICELLRFLVSLCNPLDKQNTDDMIHMGLSLLTVAFEVGADSIGKYDSLMALVKDEMCKNLFSLLNSERLTIFAANLQVCFLLFESLRSYLKFHLEHYLQKLCEIIGSENPRTPYETRELALDNLLQFCRIPEFAAELYINYDCNLYCSNLLEDLVKLLSKTTLTVAAGGQQQLLFSVHHMSLTGLLTIVENIGHNCVRSKIGVGPSGVDIHKPTGGRHSRNNSNIDKIQLEQQQQLPPVIGSSSVSVSPVVKDQQRLLNKNVVTTGMLLSGGESSGVESISNYLNENQLKRHQRKEELRTITPQELLEIKNKKRILTQGTDLFNQRPDKGVQFLQENGLLSVELNPREVVTLLRENSGFDKAMIGEYISKKKNVDLKILEYFVKSFDFTNLRIDLALRQYLETFRLPGEAPLIFLVMEHFAEHWHQCNGEPFAHADSAFRLAYAIIMLNMDQHNYNAKRLNIPMTVDDFMKNLRGLNGTADFEQEMLRNIFNGIKNDEIIMPAEQTGLIRENYLWKVLIRRGVTKDAVFHHVENSLHDRQLFQLVWGPTLTAISFIFDRSNDSTASNRPLNGLTNGAQISAHFNLHEEFDAIVLTLCKFTTLMAIPSDANDIAISVGFGQNVKARLAMKSVFSMIHEYGDCIRESWKNILDIIVQLFKLKLLPKSLMEVEDFCEPTGKIQLQLEKPLQKTESSIFSSLYSYLSSDGQRQPTYEEQEIIKIAKRCVKDCQIDQIISESKFLQINSLRELLDCFCKILKPPTDHKSTVLNSVSSSTSAVSTVYVEEPIVFLMEFLVKILIQNRDRMLTLWPNCRDQLYLLLIGAATYEYQYLLIRTTVALLKVAIYLMRNEELCSVVLPSLNMLLMLKSNVIYSISKQISTGIYELLKTSAQNIHTETDWNIIFTLLECVGAGAIPQETPTADGGSVQSGTKSDATGGEEDSMLTDRGYTSDTELNPKIIDTNIQNKSHLSPTTPVGGTATENWIIINKESDVTLSYPTTPLNSLTYPCRLLNHSSFALVKCWDSLAFIVRNVAHITPYNFESCVKCIRTFVEASLNGGGKQSITTQLPTTGKQYKKMGKSNNVGGSGSNSGGGTINNLSENSGGKMIDNFSSDSEDEDLQQRYEYIAIQLLDLMHTLHTRTAQIFRWWAEEGGALPQHSALWAHGWCPLLQGIARLANDRRRQVRMSAITCLQRALLVHDLQTLTGPEWSSCFKQVIFPLLFDLLTETPVTIERGLLDESRIRTSTIMSKVFLHHLTPLISLTTFSELWLEILDYLEKFIKVGSEMCYEAILEGLKNMLLVMNSVHVFHNSDGLTHSNLWDITWNRIGEFLPQLKDELFKNEVEQNHPMLNVTFKNNEQFSQKPIISESMVSPILLPSPVITEHIEKSNESTQLLSNNVIVEQTTEQPFIITNSMNHTQQILLGSQSQSQKHELQTLPTELTTNMNLILEPENLSLPLNSTPIILQNAGPQQQGNTLINNQHHHHHHHHHHQQQINHQNQLISLNNEYPSLTNVPQDIAKSFAPIFIQPIQPVQTQEQHQHQQQNNIYNDYVNNPYNLVLQVDHNYQDSVAESGPPIVPSIPPSAVTTTTSSSPLSPSSPHQQHYQQQNPLHNQNHHHQSTNVFQSANFFGSNQSVAIPPGSEMLFSEP